MPRFDEFDLDVKIGLNNGINDEDKGISCLLCTIGTCYEQCTTVTRFCTSSEYGC